ncbi:MAG TPA: discoidin domain-containing protein [Phycisphaerae bacterium]|nr:discoidin domain-containing protein [Phycisphaerae bacterium]
MSGEVGYILLLHIVGGLAATCLGRGTGAFRWISGFLWGMLIWVAWGLFLLSFKLPYSALSMFGGLGLIGVVLLIVSIVQSAWDRKAVWAALLSTLAIAAAAVTALQYNFAVLSYDSFNQILLGKALAYYGGFHPQVHPAMASWGAFVLVLQSAAVFLKVDFLYAPWPVMGLVFLACFIHLGRRSLQALQVKGSVSFFFAASGALLIASAYFFTFQCFYIHNNLPSAAFLSIALACMWLSIQTRDSGWTRFAVLAFMAFTLLRTEAPLFAIVFLVPLLWMDGVNRRTRLICAGPLAVLTVLWYLRLISLIGKGTDILSPAKAYILMAAMTVFLILMAIPDRPAWRRLVQSLPWLIPTLAAALAIATLVYKPQLMRDCAIAMMDNCFVKGRWGVTWAVVLGACAVAVTLPRLPRQHLWTVGPGAFVLLLWILGIFRQHPYRIGWGDSANRLMTQVLPVLVMYLILRFGHALAVTRYSDSTQHHRPRLVASLVGLWLIVFVAAARMPISRINKAKVVEEPPMSEGYDFPIAFHPRIRESYAAALSPGPATVTLDLGHTRDADRLEMTEYAPTEALTDYAWEISTDRANWKTVFDTRSSPPGDKRVINEMTSRFKMTELGPFRYLRLSFRAAQGQNRMLLRQIRLYSMPMYDWLRSLGWHPHK